MGLIATGNVATSLLTWLFLAAAVGSLFVFKRQPKPEWFLTGMGALIILLVIAAAISSRVLTGIAMAGTVILVLVGAVVHTFVEYGLTGTPSSGFMEPASLGTAGLCWAPLSPRSPCTPS